MAKQSRTFIGRDGKTYKIIYGLNNGYKVDNLLGIKRGTRAQLEKAIQYYLDTGVEPTAADIDATIPQWENVIDDLTTWRNANGLKDGLSVTDIDPQEAAFNDYYRDLYSLEEGTMGRQTLDRMEGAYANAADQQVALADAQYQQQALQQASTVKAIADQVRAERMARLRSGMSEAQIANQDMQMMMANVNALNENAALMNQGRLEGQLAQRTARDDAYMEWLNQMNARGQNAAAMAASDASDAIQTTKRYAANAAKYGAGFTGYYPNITGYNPNKENS